MLNCRYITIYTVNSLFTVSHLKYRLPVAFFIAAFIIHPAKAQMVIESLSGPVTQNEISAFKSHMLTVPAPTNGNGNVWVYGNPGKSLEACGLMYEATRDTAILNRMIYYADALLTTRNDLNPAANGGQRVTWTSKVEPIWPSTGPNNPQPAGGAIEQGQVISHLEFCALQILKTPELWDKTIPAGDANQFGATYKARALKYIKEGDYLMDYWIIPRFIRVKENNHFYFPGGANPYKPNDPAPWNQLFMLTNGFIRLVECHVILNDQPGRIAKYDAIVQPNINWFLSNVKPNRSAAGTACYTWAYALPRGMEDTNHAAYDSEGLWIAYESGRYHLSFEQMVPFANTYSDVVMGTVTNGKFAGRVDGSTGTGHGGGDNYVRDEYIYLAEFRPDKFTDMVKAEMETHKTAVSMPITARLLWEKNRRYLKATGKL